MKVFFSDVHMGDGSDSDDFHRDAELIKFLEWTDNRASEIVIVGDLYELWQARLEKIFWAHSDVIHALDARSKKITYLYGNHDALPFSKLTPEVYQREAYGPYASQNIVAMHGHQFDTYNSGNPLTSLKWPIGKYITVIIAGLEKLIHPDVDVWLDKMRKKFGDFKVEAALLQNKAWNCTDLDQVIAITDNLKKQYLAPITIFGHNHNAEICKITTYLNKYETNEWVYANCGAWVDDEYPTFIAVTNDEVQLRDGLSYEIMESVSI